MNKLLIVWSTAEIEVAKKMVLHYGNVILLQGYWDKAYIMIWGKLLAENEELQKMVAKVKEVGVELFCCVVGSDEYGVREKLVSMDVDMTHTGEILTSSLQNDWKVITF